MNWLDETIDHLANKAANDICDEVYPSFDKMEKIIHKNMQELVNRITGSTTSQEYRNEK